LQLPPELRNAVYRYVVVDAEQIKVETDGIQEAPLLMTCKAIRQEAVTLYWVENEFEIIMTDHDISAGLRLRAMFRIAVHRGEISRSLVKSLRVASPSVNPN
jgi:hypothetical protein